MRCLDHRKVPSPRTLGSDLQPARGWRDISAPQPSRGRYSVTYCSAREHIPAQMARAANGLGRVSCHNAGDQVVARSPLAPPCAQRHVGSFRHSATDTSNATDTACVTSVIVPAHNEDKGLGRLLESMLRDTSTDGIEIIVVANGCSDRTAQVAREYADVRVVETPVASKSQALRLGDRAASSFPRLYVDADVVLSSSDVRVLCAALNGPGILAAGPSRRIMLDGRPWPVRWYYDVWQRLPGVRSELYGRGVIAVSEAGHYRISRLPEMMSDDLAAALAFFPDEIVIAGDVEVVIFPPRSVRDLLRRRVRAMTGTTQLEQASDTGLRPLGRTSPRQLLSMTGRRPWLAPKVALFLCIALLARHRSRQAVRRADFSTWLRDESSRA